MFLISANRLVATHNEKDVLTISMSRAVYVAIVPVAGLVLDVGGVNSDTTSLFFRGLIDFGVTGELGTTFAGKDLGDCGGQSGFTVINVTYAGSQPKLVMKCSG